MQGATSSFVNCGLMCYGYNHGSSSATAAPSSDATTYGYRGQATVASPATRSIQTAAAGHPHRVAVAL